MKILKNRKYGSLGPRKWRKPPKVGDFVTSTAFGTPDVGQIKGINGAYVNVEIIKDGKKHVFNYYITELKHVHWTQISKVRKQHEV